MKEQLSIAYIQMRIAAAGCSVMPLSTDYDGVDLAIRSNARYSAVVAPTLDVQLKCTSQKVVGKEFVSWRIDQDAHGRLTSTKRFTPLILAVLVVPSDQNLWLDHNEERLLTESTMYWILGKDIGPYPSGQEKMTVNLPRSQRLTRESLLGLMEDIGEGVLEWRV